MNEFKVGSRVQTKTGGTGMIISRYEHPTDGRPAWNYIYDGEQVQRSEYQDNLELINNDNKINIVDIIFINQMIRVSLTVRMWSNTTTTYK